jgi:hypothetical protein
MNQVSLLLRALALSAVTLIAATGCGHRQSNSPVLDIGGIRANGTLSPAAKAEQLALAAEQLISYSGFTYADMVATEALQLDATNVRARFWKAALGPSMQLRGVVNRLAPLAKSSGEEAEYLNFVHELKASSMDRANAVFLMDGPQDIQGEIELQDLVAQMTVKVDDFRTTMKGLKNETLEINLNTDLKRAASEEARNCQVTQVNEGSYETSGCDSVTVTSLILNQADFEALQQGAAGLQTYLAALNSYNLDGAISVAKNNKAPKSPQETLQALLVNPKFGTLRATQTLDRVPELGKDLILGVRYAQKMQTELCPTGEKSASNRPHHLFGKGFCTVATTQSEADLKAIELVLGGASELISIQAGEKSIPVLVNPTALLHKPLADVRTLLPVSYNKCGELASVGDATLGGIFPNGDFNRLLQSKQTETQCNY